LNKPRTFELTKTQQEGLCALAEKEGISPSAFINRLLFAAEESKQFGEMGLDPNALKGILNCATEEDLAEAGRKFGEDYPKSHLGEIKRLCDYESCYELLIKLFDERNNWYSYKINETPEITRFIFLDSNSVGKKWLRFVGEYAAAITRTVLNVEVKMSIAPDQVVLEIPKPKKDV
jgi:hypothetical protein